jgi:hypothetical protein
MNNCLNGWTILSSRAESLRLKKRNFLFHFKGLKKALRLA